MSVKKNVDLGNKYLCSVDFLGYNRYSVVRETVILRTCSRKEYQRFIFTQYDSLVLLYKEFEMILGVGGESEYGSILCVRCRDFGSVISFSCHSNY